MSRVALILALDKFRNAEYTDENVEELQTEIDCAMDGELTCSECEDLAVAFLNLG